MTIDKMRIFAPITTTLLALSPGAPPNLDDSTMLGISIYASSLAGLTAWEALAVPALKRKGLIPDIPLNPFDLTEAEKDSPFLIPLTSDQAIPHPSIKEIIKLEEHMVGRRGRVGHFISVQAFGNRIEGRRTKSKDWSSFYNRDIFIEKRIMR